MNDKKNKKRVKMYFLIFLFIAIFLGAFGQISLKYGLNKVGKITFQSLFTFNGFTNVFSNLFILLGCLFYLISLFAWLTALSSLDVSYMYPLLSISYVITAFIAFFLLKENITLFRWIGIIFILIGSYFIMKS